MAGLLGVILAGDAQAQAQKRAPPRQAAVASKVKLPKVAPFPPARPRPATARPAVSPPGAPTAPSPATTQVAAPPELSACRQRLTPEFAVIHALPPITGEGGCGVADPVRLEAIKTDKGQVTLAPPAVVRCEMAEAITHWVREDVAPALAGNGGVAALTSGTGYECRGRNRAAGARLSEHATGNALDLRGLKLANGKALDLTDPDAPKELRQKLQASACARFTTVLGPGSDGMHEDHIHMDILERRGGYRICQWSVLDAAEAAALAAVAAAEAARDNPQSTPIPHDSGKAPGTIGAPATRRTTTGGKIDPGEGGSRRRGR